MARSQQLSCELGLRRFVAARQLTQLTLSAYAPLQLKRSPQRMREVLKRSTDIGLLLCD